MIRFLLLLLVVLAGCVGAAPEPARFAAASHASAGSARIEAFFEPDPPRQKGNTVWLRVTRGGSPVIDGVAVEAMMPEMGAMPEMRSRADVAHVGDGVWRATFDLEMGGSWSLEVDVGDEQGAFAFTVGSRGLVGDDAAPPAVIDLPDLALSDDALDAVRRGFVATGVAHDALVRDLLPGELRISEALLIDAPPELTGWLQLARSEAAGLAAARELPEARDRFAGLNRALFALASADARLTEGLVAYACPMRQGFAKWFQVGGAMENPYMGREMPGCGSPTDWTTLGPAPGGEGAVRIDEGRRQQFGVRTAPVTRGVLTRDIRALGQVVWDDTRVTDVVLTTGGYVRDLRVDETGQRVRKGEVLFTLYGPELYAAQREFLLANARAPSDPLAMAARDKLRLLGLTDAQLRDVAAANAPVEAFPIVSPVDGYVVEKEIVAGTAFMAGERVYRIAPLDRVWVEADLWSEDVPHVTSGTAAVVSLPNLRGARFEGVVQLLQPKVGAIDHTRTARIALTNPDERLLPGMYADVDFRVELGERLLVPESAVMYAGRRKLVFVDAGDGRLVPREVEVGARSGPDLEVIAGLSEGEQVVASGTFLVAAESRLRAGTALWSDDAR